MLYVYGILDVSSFAAIAGEGVSASNVEPLPCGNISAAVGEVPSTVPPTPQNIWRHEHVLERLMQNYTVLPMRFGTVCHGAVVLRAALETYRSDLHDELRRLQGKVEFALHASSHAVAEEANAEAGAVVTPTEDISANGHGPVRERMRLLRRKPGADLGGRYLQALLFQYLGGIAADTIFHVPSDRASSVSAACLVDKRRLTAFDRAVSRLREERTDIRVDYTGPWAPYSFVMTQTIGMGRPGLA